MRKTQQTVVSGTAHEWLRVVGKVLAGKSSDNEKMLALHVARSIGDYVQSAVNLSAPYERVLTDGEWQTFKFWIDNIREDS